MSLRAISPFPNLTAQPPPSTDSVSSMSTTSDSFSTFCPIQDHDGPLQGFPPSDLIAPSRSTRRLEALEEDRFLEILRSSIYNPKGPWLEDLQSYWENEFSLGAATQELRDEASARGLSDRITHFEQRADFQTRLYQLPVMCREIQADLASCHTFYTIRFKGMTAKDGKATAARVEIGRPYTRRVTRYAASRLLGESAEETRDNIEKAVRRHSAFNKRLPSMTKAKAVTSGPYLEDMNDGQLLALLKKYPKPLEASSSRALWKKKEKQTPLLKALLEEKEINKRPYIRLLLEELEARTATNPYLSKNLEQIIRFISKRHTRKILPDIVEDANESSEDVSIKCTTGGVVMQYQSSTCRIPSKQFVSDTVQETRVKLNTATQKHIASSQRWTRLSRPKKTTAFRAS